MKPQRPSVPVLVTTLITIAGVARAQERLPNEVRYRDTSARPAVGRAGSAAVSAVAVKDVTGVTELTLVPSSALTGEPGGTVERAVVKVYYDQAIDLETGTTRGRSLAFTRTLEAPADGGLMSATFDGLTRTQRVEVQANVTGIDPNRTDVVTVETWVVNAPSVAPVGLVGGGEVHAGAPVIIGAVVREWNGDLGATATCVLYVDGVEADRVEGLWVDRGSAVTCAFTHVFADVGVHHVAVAVEEVTPRDYDGSDNVIEATVSVVDPTYRLASSAGLIDRDISEYRRYESEYLSDRHSHLQFSEQHREGWEQQLSFNAWGDKAFSVVDASITIAETTLGETVVNVDAIRPNLGHHSYATFTSPVYDERGFWVRDAVHEVRDEHGWFEDGRGGLGSMTIHLHTVDGAPLSQWSTVGYQRWSGDVVYWGRNYSLLRDGDGPWRGYDYTFNEHSQRGERRELGPDYRVDMEILSGPQQILASITVPLRVEETTEITGPTERAAPPGSYPWWREYLEVRTWIRMTVGSAYDTNQGPP